MAKKEHVSFDQVVAAHLSTALNLRDNVEELKKEKEKRYVDIDRFNELSSTIVDEAKPRLRTRRAHGRPHGGRAVFQQVRIDALPELATPSQVANALGVRYITVIQWCTQKKNPIPCALTKTDKRRVFSKPVVVKWLIATRRYKPHDDAPPINGNGKEEPEEKEED